MKMVVMVALHFILMLLEVAVVYLKMKTSQQEAVVEVVLVTH